MSCRKTNETGNHHFKQNKLGSESKISGVFSHMGNLGRKERKADDMKVEGRQR